MTIRAEYKRRNLSRMSGSKEVEHSISFTMSTTLAIHHKPADHIREAILAPLAEFNAEHGYPADPQQVAITITNDAGEIVGGLWGRTIYSWLYVDYLVVPHSLRGRGLGADLLRSAEDLARGRGCIGSWLTTFSFQAQGFYETQGYEVFGALDHSPRDNRRIFLRKRLDR